jgi:hypothetical protein
MSSCPHCFQALDGHESTDISTPVLPVVPHDDSVGTVDITAGSAGMASSNAASRDGAPWQPPAGPPRKRSGLPALAVSLLVAVAAVVAALVFLRSGDEAAGAGDAEPVPVADSPSSDDAVTQDGVTQDGARLDPDASAGIGTTDPLAADRLVSDSVAQLFRNDIGDWAVIYPSPMGLQILSEAGTVQPAIETATGFEEAAQFPLISDGRRSWAVDPGQLDLAYLVSTQFVVIDIDQDGRVAFINDLRDPRNIGESSYGAWGPGFDVPADAEILAIRERGLFVLPRTGGTFEYVPNGVEAFSDDVLVAASIDSEVLERCDESLVCELYITTPAHPEPRVIDFGARDQVWISPGGEWLVARTLAGESLLLSTETGERTPLAGSVRAVDWSDDAQIAAILTDQELTMVFPGQAESQSVTLPIAPSASAVLLVPTG